MLNKWRELSAGKNKKHLAKAVTSSAEAPAQTPAYITPMATALSNNWYESGATNGAKSFCRPTLKTPSASPCAAHVDLERSGPVEMDTYCPRRGRVAVI